MDSVKISALELENVKRIRAVSLKPSESGLTVIGGNNSQGKTSVLDAITWALGGDRNKPSTPVRDGSAVPPAIKVTLSNGLVVERSGKNSTLKVTDPSGLKGGQQLLNSFIEELALNLPKFMEKSGKDKASMLLRTIGVEDQLKNLEQTETDIYNRRRVVGQEADRKKKYFESLPFYPDAPQEAVSTTDLIRRQQAIIAANAANQHKRMELTQVEARHRRMASDVANAEANLRKLREQFSVLDQALTDARDAVAGLRDESTAKIEQDLANIDTINNAVRANQIRAQAARDAAGFKAQYDDLTAKLDKTRQAKMDLLNDAKLPLDGLSVDSGELIYKGKKWDCMSGSEQLKVATAIVRALNPRCGFVLLDKLEQMDMPTLQEFGAWLQSQNLQAIATRVSTGSECTIIIEDGCVRGIDHE